MKVFSLVPLLGLFSLATANGVHRIKLNKEPHPPALVNPSAAAAQLARKYGANQEPPNAIDSTAVAREEGYFYTQNQQVMGGHEIPLDSSLFLMTLFRSQERELIMFLQIIWVLNTTLQFTLENLLKRYVVDLSRCSGQHAHLLSSFPLSLIPALPTSGYQVLNVAL